MANKISATIELFNDFVEVSFRGARAEMSSYEELARKTVSHTANIRYDENFMIVTFSGKRSCMLGIMKMALDLACPDGSTQQMFL